MNVPPEIAFRHVEPTPTLKKVVQEGIDSIERIYPRMTSCRVMVEETSRGIPHVRLDIGLPGNDLIVNREAASAPASRDLAASVREAFDVARRQLREQQKVVVDERRREAAPPTRQLEDQDEEES